MKVDSKNKYARILCMVSLSLYFVHSGIAQAFQSCGVEPNSKNQFCSVTCPPDVQAICNEGDANTVPECSCKIRKNDKTNVAVVKDVSTSFIRQTVESSGYRSGKENVFPPSRNVDFPEYGVVLGQGWDSVTDKPTPSTCISFSHREVGGQTAHVENKRIFESDTLRHEVGQSYSASAKASFGIGGGGASYKQEFLNTSEVNNQFVNLLVKAEVQNGAEFVSPDGTPKGIIELTGFAQEIVKPKSRGFLAQVKPDINEFVRQCGDSFVSSIQRGASLFALYQFASKTKSDSEKKTTTIDVNGSYMAFSGSASTSNSDTKSAISKNEVTGLKYMHTAHRGLHLPNNEESIASSIASLGSALDLKDAAPYKVTLVRYDSLPSWPSDKLNIGDAEREAAMALYLRLVDLQEVTKRISRSPNDFDLTKPNDIVMTSRLPNLINDRIDSLKNELENCQVKKSLASDINAKIDATNSCITNITTDTDLTDYPYRALFPVPNEYLNAYLIQHPIPAQAKLDADTKSLTDAISHYNSSPIRLHWLITTCTKSPDLNQCRDEAKNISKLRDSIAADNLAISNEVVYKIAAARFDYWIFRVERSREESGLINANLSDSELDMWKRDIYCQYHVSPDNNTCPSELLSEMVFNGQPMKQTQAVSINNLQGSGVDSATAWKDLQDKITSLISTTADEKPYFFNLSDEAYQTKSDGSKVTISLTAKANLTFYGTTQLKKLLQQN